MHWLSHRITNGIPRLLQSICSLGAFLCLSIILAEVGFARGVGLELGIGRMFWPCIRNCTDEHELIESSDNFNDIDFPLNVRYF